ncbi:MAG: hypothetical protein J0H63_08745 [Rhizobiales bacterium]|nr:hypothetical protein [Hyphomicrobiales bacterium]MBN9010202.1 hypothetical protein [Hyphomicrobiales bacterium]
MTNKLNDALTDLVKGKISRRAFMQRAVALGVSASVVGSLLEATASAEESGAFPVSGPQGEGSGGTLVVGQESNWDVLDPALGTGAVTWRTCLYQIYENLANREMNNPEGLTGADIPGITEKIERSDDGKTYTFHLRSGISFTDGTPFDADAVMWNVARQWDQTKSGGTNAPQFDPTMAAIRSWYWDPTGLQKMHAPDPQTVVFELAKPFSQFVSAMPEAGLGTMGMASPKVWKDSGNAGVAATPVGTGPFLFESQTPGDTLSIVKNPNYWDKANLAKLDRIVYKALPDSATRVAALRAGEVNMIFAPPAQELQSLKDAGFVITARPNSHLWYLQLNANEPYFKDVRARQAFFMAINRAGMAKQLLKDTCLPAISINTRTCPAWSDNAGYADYDPAAAKKLLADAGFPDGFETTFQIPTGGSGEIDPVPMAEWIAADAAKIGIKIKLETMEWISYLHAWAAGMGGGIGMNQMSWGMTSMYWPNLPLRTTSSLNVGHQMNKDFDTLMDEANSALDPQVALAKYRAVDALNAKEMYVVPIVNDLAPVVTSPNVMNFVHSPDWWWDFKKVWVKS